MKRIISAIALLSFGFPIAAFAATLTFSSGSSYSIGDSIPVSVLVASDASINAVGATVAYPKDSLELLSVSKAGSIINYWAQEPTFSQSDGTVNFQGIIFDPGWNGSGGKVVQLIFKAKQAGAAALSFSDAQVLANDGKGTNILTAAPAYSLTIRAAAPAPAQNTPTPTPAPAQSSSSGGSPKITSSTHPDENRWYNKSAVSLDWSNVPGTSAVRIGYDKSPSGTPTVLYGAISHKDLTLGEGIWYFHVQDQTASGWGPIATRRIKIDMTPPLAMNLRFPHGATSTDPRPVALFNTTDALSGVDHYSIAINGNSLFTLTTEDVESNPYALPEQAPGPGTLFVSAYDAAGNSTSASGNFDIEGIIPPKLDPIPDIQSGDLLQVTGIAMPSSRVDLYVTDANGNESSQWTRTAGNGAFKVIWNSILSPGTYRVSAKDTDDKGATSIKTDPVTFQVEPAVIGHIGKFIFLKQNAIPAVIVFGILMLIALLWLFERSYHGELIHRHPKGDHAHVLVH
ncbi:MAG: hypothetical protein JO019_00260, partial [Candidatus Kaiserbacteria bacterium]|nr:hypothetical protein [Candidatus Kaiserbacteria bacterium]